MLGIPVMQLTLFGYAIRQDVRNLPTVVYDASRTQESRELVQQFGATGNFRITREVASYDQALRRVDAGQAHAAIIIPDDYARDLKRGRPAQVQVLVDASDPTASQSAIGAAQLVGQRGNLRLTAQRFGTAFQPGRLPLPGSSRGAISVAAAPASPSSSVKSGPSCGRSSSPLARS